MAIVTLATLRCGNKLGEIHTFQVLYDAVTMVMTSIVATTKSEAVWLRVCHPTDPAQDFSTTVPANSTALPIVLPVGFTATTVLGKPTHRGIELRWPA
jgi:hypothetical protein